MDETMNSEDVLFEFTRPGERVALTWGRLVSYCRGDERAAQAKLLHMMFCAPAFNRKFIESITA